MRRGRAKPAQQIIRVFFQGLVFLVCAVAAMYPAPQNAAAAYNEYEFDISAGAVSIVPDTPGKLDVEYNGHAPVTLDESDFIIIKGTTSLDYIEVKGPVNCNIRLKDVKIDVGSGSGASKCAFAVITGATVNLTLEGSNEVTSADGEAGLHVDVNSEVIIGSADGTDSGGSLKATGSANGDGGAGIGGSAGAGGGGAGTITVTSGTIMATGAKYAAGIGGGQGGGGGSIVLKGGTVTAAGGWGAAGIGGGREGGFSDIVISAPAFIRSAAGGNADGGTHIGGGAGIGTGGTDNTSAPIASGSILISSGVDLADISGGQAEPGGAAEGTKIGSGGGDGVAGQDYDALHTIAFHANDDPDVIQELTYTVHGGSSDAVLPVLTEIQRHNASFVPLAFDGFWYETPLAGRAYGAGARLSAATLFDLYAKGWEDEPKMGL